MVSTKYCIILTTTNDKHVADGIARYLLDADLTSCVQIDDVKSHFKWEGKISIEKEFRVMIKARSEHYKKIELVIMDKHNYQLPQIAMLAIEDGLKDYLNWLK